MRSTFVFVKSLIIFFILSTFSVFADSSGNQTFDSIVKGWWQVEYLISDPHECLIPVSVNTLGYIQDVKRIHRGYQITVTCPLEPIIINEKLSDNAVTQCCIDDSSLKSNLKITENLSDGVRTVFGWLNNNVEYTSNTDSPTSLESILQTGQASCVGRSIAAVTVLKSLGYNCRTISGCLYKNGDSHFHRWIEVVYPGTGSLPSDTGTTQDYITPYHLRLLPTEKVHPNVNRLSALGVSISIVKEKRQYFITDGKPAPETATTALMRRQTSSEQHQNVLTGLLKPGDAAPFMINIKGTDYSKTLQSDQFGCFSIPALPSGTYQMDISAMGFRGDQLSISIGSREHVHIQRALVK